MAGSLGRAPTVSVVICTRNRPDSVRSTLRSVAACRYPAERREAIVVDNAAPGEAPVELDEAAPGSPLPARVLREPEPGLSNARNAGLGGASGEIVAFADDDVEVNREWLIALTRPFADERVGATSGRTLPGALETRVQRWTEGFGGRRRSTATRVFDMRDPPPDQPLFPFAVGELGAGRNMAFRHDLLTRLGGFDPALGPGTPAHDGDDIEALLRVLLAGHKIVHDPAAIVWHAHPTEYGELRDRVWGYGIGLTACLTKAVLDHPRLLIDLVRKLPRGLVFALSPSSAKNAGRQDDFPRSLAWLELLGMAYGPIAYTRSRLRLARRRSRLSPGRRPGRGRGLRVLIITDEYPPVVGGAARNIALLAEQLSRRGHSVTVATSWQPQSPAREDGAVAVRRIRDLTSRMRWISADPNRHHPPPFPDPEGVARLRRLIAEVEPDLVHAYGWMAAWAAAASSGLGVPLLLSAHDYGNVCAKVTLLRDGHPCSGPAPAKCLACASRAYGIGKGTVAVASVLGAAPLLRRRVKAMHSVSRSTAEVVDRNLRIPGVTSVVVPNFFADGSEDPIDEGLLADLPSEPFVLFVGHLRPYKGIDVLLSAYERADAPPPLVMVGTLGPDTPECFPAGVKVLTYVPHATVMAIWERSLFGVSPSIAPEALPSVVLEAMSKGKAMVASDIGGYRDMIEDGVSGLMVPPGAVEPLAEAIGRLSGDAELRERLERGAAERARDFSSEAVMPRIERLYRDTIAGGGSR